MKIITQTILTAEEGYFLTDGVTYGKTVVLPAGEETSRWHEITEEEAEKLMNEGTIEMDCQIKNEE